MEKDIRDEELAAMQAEGEEEVICVVLTDEQGNEQHTPARIKPPRHSPYG